MNIEKGYKDAILKVWSDFENLEALNKNDCEYRKFPIAPLNVKENSILFIGINPSFGKGKKVDSIQNRIEFYGEINDEEIDMPYFEKFKNVSKYCDEKWTHLDLLFIRETDQKVIRKMMTTPNGIDFINRQLDISFEIIEKSNPKIIVVANALASEFFGKKKIIHKKFEKIWKGYRFDFEDEKSFNNEIGTYKISLNNEQIPIIFSGMLSGQRALDIGSLERLKWQVKMILNKNKR